MPFVIVLAPEAIEDLKALQANARAVVRAELEKHLRHEPRRTSRSRIKRLRGLIPILTDFDPSCAGLTRASMMNEIE